MDSALVSEFVDARVGPRGSLENLSQDEIGKLLDSGQGGLYPLFRKCALAVLNSGDDTDNAKEKIANIQFLTFIIQLSFFVFNPLTAGAENLRNFSSYINTAASMLANRVKAANPFLQQAYWTFS